MFLPGKSLCQDYEAELDDKDETIARLKALLEAKDQESKAAGADMESSAVLKREIERLKILLADKQDEFDRMKLDFKKKEFKLKQQMLDAEEEAEAQDSKVKATEQEAKTKSIVQIKDQNERLKKVEALIGEYEEELEQKDERIAKFKALVLSLEDERNELLDELEGMENN